MLNLFNQFDHIGIAVRDTDTALITYRDILGGIVTTYREIGTTEDYYFTQFILGKQKIELIEPRGQSESFLTKFLAKWGEGLHHLTFQVESIKIATDRLKENGLKITDEFYEDPNWKIAFISPRGTSGVLIQLYETTFGSKYDHVSPQVL
jgi:methylmalonyl-CoA/ethylmalonyl-CoA epimerase